MVRTYLEVQIHRGRKSAKAGIAGLTPQACFLRTLGAHLSRIRRTRLGNGPYGVPTTRRLQLKERDRDS